MKRSILLFLFILFAGMSGQAEEFTSVPASLTGAGFEKIAVIGGVTVYQDRKSEIIRMAAEGRIDAPPELVRTAVLDYKKQIGVVGRVSISTILEQGPDWLLVYQRLNLPVISDRDVILKVDWGADGEVLWVKYHAVTDRGPEKVKNVVRITKNEGSWQVIPIDSGRASMVRYQMSMDLAGLVPKYLARVGADKEIPKLFESIRKVANMEGGGNQGNLP